MAAEDTLITVGILGALGFVGYRLWKEGKFDGLFPGDGAGGGSEPDPEPFFTALGNPSISQIASTVRIDWQVENTGDAAGQASLELTVAGEETGAAFIWIPAGEARTVSMVFDTLHLPAQNFTATVHLLLNGQRIGVNHQFNLLGQGAKLERVDGPNWGYTRQPNVWDISDSSSQYQTYRWVWENVGGASIEGELRMHIPLLELDLVGQVRGFSPGEQHELFISIDRDALPQGEWTGWLSMWDGLGSNKERATSHITTTLFGRAETAAATGNFGLVSA